VFPWGIVRVWRIYAWILLLLTATSWLDLFRAEIGTRDLIDIPISIVFVVGVFAFAYHRRLVARVFWRVWPLVQVGWDLSYNVLGLDRGGRGLALYLALTVPGYVALLLYGYRSGPLWRGDLARAEEAP